MKVSVITATYNSRETISEALESVLGQLGVEVELIVIDGGSTDGTLDILERYAPRLAVLVSERDGGIYDALNKGLGHATGEIVGFLHSDDLMATNKTLKQISDAFVDRSVDAVYGDLVYVRKGDTGHVVRNWRAGNYSRARLKAGWMPPHPTFYVRRAVYERMGGFDETFRVAADYDCMLRFLWQAQIKCHYVPDVLIKMRLGGASNRSVANILRKSAEDYQVIRRHKVGGVGTLLWKNIRKLPQFVVRK